VSADGVGDSPFLRRLCLQVLQVDKTVPECPECRRMVDEHTPLGVERYRDSRPEFSCPVCAWSSLFPPCRRKVGSAVGWEFRGREFTSMLQWIKVLEGFGRRNEGRRFRLGEARRQSRVAGGAGE
jgi:hypothetical protein